MAVSRGQQSTEGATRKLFIGVGSSYILAVNPTKEEIEKIRNRSIDYDVEYTGTTEVNGNTIKQIRIDLYAKPDPAKYLDNNNQPIEAIIPVSFYLKDQKKIGSNTGKIQVIDNYGRTAWVTPEELEGHKIPQYANGPANIDKDYRPTYDGEEDLVNAIIAFLNIPSTVAKVDGKFVSQTKEFLDVNCQVSLEHIADYFKGDVSELKEIFGYRPDNKVKIAFGVKTNDEGKQYQAAYTKKFLKNSVNDYSKLDEAIAQTKGNGGLATTEFECDELHEYVVASSSFANEAPAATPWGGSEPSY